MFDIIQPFSRVWMIQEMKRSEGMVVATVLLSKGDTADLVYGLGDLMY